jgi:hypothetical protein
MNRNSTQAGAAGLRHEVEDVSIRPVLRILAVFVAGILAAIAFLAWLTSYYERDAARRDPGMSAVATERVTAPPEPTLQASPQTELQEFEQSQYAELTRWRWIDKQRGIAQVPVDIAMRLVARHGLPQWAAREATSQRSTIDSTGAPPRAEQAPSGSPTTTGAAK